MIGRKQSDEHGGGQEPPSTLFGLSASSLGSHSGGLSRMGVTKSLRASTAAYLRESTVVCQGAACSHFQRCNKEGKELTQLTHFGGGRAATSPSVSPDSRLISFRLCDEVYWRDGKLSARAYKEKRGDKRPVWVMGIDGANPQLIEPLHFLTTIDGSRAPWGPK